MTENLTIYLGLDVELPQVLFRLTRWENLEHAKEI